MDKTVLFSKDPTLLKKYSKDVIFLSKHNVHCVIFEGVNAAFYFNKSIDMSESDLYRNKRRLFLFLASLGDVVCTNRSDFIPILTGNMVAEIMIQRYGPTNPNIRTIDLPDTSASLYCALNVPAVRKFLTGVGSLEDDITILVCVGFEKEDDCEDDHRFKNSFVVIERKGEFEVVYAEPMDNDNTLITEQFMKLLDSGKKKGIEKVALLLSQ